MYRPRNSFTPPPDNAVLWRYISFTKFVSLLTRKALFFARADKLGDPYEGSLSQWNVNLSLTPNPPMDGVRIAAGWVRELQGRWLGSIGVDWRSADGLQSPQRAIGALCGSCDARDGERIRSRELSRTGVARVCGEVGSVAGWQSGGEWNGSQSGHGASELGFPRPMLGKMQGKPARRAGDPSHQSEEPPPEGFGGRDPFTQADAGCPAGQVVRHHLYRQPGAVGAHRDVFHSSCPALERLPQLTSFGPPMVARRL